MTEPAINSNELAILAIRKEYELADDNQKAIIAAAAPLSFVDLNGVVPNGYSKSVATSSPTPFWQIYLTGVIATGNMAVTGSINFNKYFKTTISNNGTSNPRMGVSALVPVNTIPVGVYSFQLSGTATGQT